MLPSLFVPLSHMLACSFSFCSLHWFFFHSYIYIPHRPYYYIKIVYLRMCSLASICTHTFIHSFTHIHGCVCVCCVSVYYTVEFWVWVNQTITVHIARTLPGIRQISVYWARIVNVLFLLFLLLSYFTPRWFIVGTSQFTESLRVAHINECL